jgi:hypothetical protein
MMAANKSSRATRPSSCATSTSRSRPRRGTSASIASQASSGSHQYLDWLPSHLRWHVHTPVLSACNNILNAIAVSSKDHNHDKNYTVSETIIIRKRGDERRGQSRSVAKGARRPRSVE